MELIIDYLIDTQLFSWVFMLCVLGAIIFSAIIFSFLSSFRSASDATNQYRPSNRLVLVAGCAQQLSLWFSFRWHVFCPTGNHV